MNLGSLLKVLGNEEKGFDVNITSVTESIENVEKGSLFVAVKGKNHDGKDYIEEAFLKGAAAVISEEESDDKRIIKVRDARLSLSFLCSAFYSHPQDSMRIIGITGTNGKTTTAGMLKHIFEFCGEKCAVIGTLGCFFGDYYSNTGYTTPSPEILFRELCNLKGMGARTVIMEVSSQALIQKRVEPIEFYLSVFTNLGTDHLDYHGNMNEYASSKKRLLQLGKNILINSDDAYAGFMRNDCTGKAYTFSVKNAFADFSAKNIRYTEDRTSFLILSHNLLERVSYSLVGEYQVYNALCAVSSALICGLNIKNIAEAMMSVTNVKGRAEKVYDGEFRVYIDYAHTPEALYSVISALNNIKKFRLLTVFGCGGDRDKTKRSEMGKIASAMSDFTVVTSDNPRNEAPEKIIEDILEGVSDRSKVFVEPDRKKAIDLALNKAQKGDVVLIAGKGHEKSQLICGENRYFSDEESVEECMKSILR